MNIRFKKPNALSLLVILYLNSCNGDISDEAKTLAYDWAPLIWIHPDELFFPSNVDFQLSNMEVMKNVLGTGSQKILLPI